MWELLDAYTARAASSRCIHWRTASMWVPSVGDLASDETAIRANPGPAADDAS
jgi:hypothetical protein